MKIALCQLDIAWEDKEKNLFRAEGFLEKAASEKVDLVLFPEMTLTGFSMNIARTAESDKASEKNFAALAKRHSLAIGFGWVETAGNKARNHYTVVSSEGETLSDYVKIHPFSYADEDRFFIPGDKLSFFSIGDIEVSTFICYDLRFPEIFQAASGRAGLLVVAANWPALRKEHWRALLRARAIENQAFVAGINCVGAKGGLDYSGNTSLIDPHGNIMAELDCVEDMIIAGIDTDAVKRYRESFPQKKDRKNDFYKSIL